MGAGTAALGAVGSLSGCSAIQDLLPGGGGGLGDFTNWVYEPDTFEADNEGLNSSATSYTDFFSNSGNLSDFAVLSAKGNNYPQLGIDVEDVAMELSLPDGRVITGSFDTESVKSELGADPVETPTSSGFGGTDGMSGSTQYESDGTYNDYDIYVQEEPEESPNAFAIGDPVRGGLSLGVLGLGTIPTLLAYGTVLGSVSPERRATLHRGLRATFLLLGYIPLSHGLLLLGFDVPTLEVPFYQPLV